MNPGTLLVIAIVAVITIADVKYLSVHGLDSCSGNCAECGTSCKWVNDVKKAQSHIQRQKKIRRFFGLDKA